MWLLSSVIIISSNWKPPLALGKLMNKRGTWASKASSAPSSQYFSKESAEKSNLIKSNYLNLICITCKKDIGVEIGSKQFGQDGKFDTKLSGLEALGGPWEIRRVQEVWRVQEIYKVCGGLEAPISPKVHGGPELRVRQVQKEHDECSRRSGRYWRSGGFREVQRVWEVQKIRNILRSLTFGKDLRELESLSVSEGPEGYKVREELTRPGRFGRIRRPWKL